MTTSPNPMLAATMERIDAFVIRCKEKNHQIVFIDCEGGKHSYVEATFRSELVDLRYTSYGMDYETQIDERCPITFLGKRLDRAIKGLDVDGESWVITTRAYLDVLDMMASV